TFSPDGKTIASGAVLDGTVTLWDAVTLKPHATLKAAAIRGAYRLTFSPDGALLAEGSEDDLVLWDVSRRKVFRRLPERRATSIASAPDGKTLACWGSGEVIRLWDVATGEPLHQRPGHDQHVWSVSVSPDGKVMASTALHDPVLRLW